MPIRPLLLGVLLVAAAFTLIRALVTGDGVGVVEYVAGAAIFSALVLVLFRLSRRAIRRA
jgi:hypothetical protein